MSRRICQTLGANHRSILTERNSAPLSAAEFLFLVGFLVKVADEVGLPLVRHALAGMLFARDRFCRNRHTHPTESLPALRVPLSLLTLYTRGLARRSRKLSSCVAGFRSALFSSLRCKNSFKALTSSVNFSGSFS